jgi:hypothetical protein
MKLLTKAIKNKLPKLYETEEIATKDKVVQVKFFCPWNSWTWYGVEFNPETNIFFGYVDGHYGEWGYFNLDELKSITHWSTLKIERDMYFEPKPFNEICN